MTHQPTPLRAIFFDLGMVLFTFDWDLAIPRFAARNGSDTQRIKKFLTHPYHDAFERNEMTGTEFFERGRDEIGFQGTQEEFETYWSEIFAEIPNNVRLFRQLAAHYPVYALSNTNPWHAAYLEANFDCMKLFSGKLYSFTLGVRKPERKIYQDALTRTGVPAGSVLFIDDKLENIETANELGFRTIHLTSPDLLEASLKNLLSSPNHYEPLCR